MTKQKTTLKLLFLAAAGSLGLAASALAQSANIAPPVPETEPTAGLLGKTYTGVSWNYVDFDGSAPTAGRGLTATFNQPLNPLLDVQFNYDYLRAGAYGVHLSQHQFDGGVVAYQSYSWGRPFVDAGAGWVWQRGGGYSDDSFAYRVGAGVEFQVSPRLSMSPFVTFRRAVSFNASEVDLGVKAAYRINRDWSVTAKAQYDAVRHEKDATEYSLGVAYHF